MTFIRETKLIDKKNNICKKALKYLEILVNIKECNKINEEEKRKK